MQRTQLIGVSGKEHFETYVPFDGENYHEWIVEELPDKQFRLWHWHGFPENGRLSYDPDVECGEARLIEAGFGDVPRVRHPDTVL